MSVQYPLTKKQVLSEITTLRNGWSQAKQIIKQQRKTIKAQEIAIGNLTYAPQHAQPPQQQPASRGGGAAAAGAPAAGQPGSVLKYPITSWLLQRQQQHQQNQAPTSTGMMPPLPLQESSGTGGARRCVGGVGGSS